MNTAAYCLLTLRPSLDRVDVVCVGTAVLSEEFGWQIHMMPDVEKLRVVAGEVPANRLVHMSENLSAMLANCNDLPTARALLSGFKSAVSLHEFEGFFCYEGAESYAAQVSAIMRESVLTPEPASHRVRRRTRRVSTRARLRQQFGQMGIMGSGVADIGAHKVVHNYPVSPAHGLAAEFALRNSVMHITETIDFAVSSVRSKQYEAQAKCLVMRAAKATFGTDTECYVVVSGAESANAGPSVDLLSTTGRVFSFDDSHDMEDYLGLIASAAGA